MTEDILMQRIEDLESRIKALEERARNHLWANKETLKEREMVGKYGAYVDKQQTADILGVTRATVYAMINDGRIETACAGKRVDTRSLARFIASKGDKYNVG